MNTVEDFIKKNRLKAKDVAEYLGISKGYMSRLVSGQDGLPTHQFRKLLENDKGWDTTMLEDGGSINATTTAGRDATVSIRNSYGESGKLRETNTRLTTENEMLREKIDEQRTIIAELKAEKEKYWELIQKLMK